MIIFFNFLLFFIQTGVMCWLWRMKSCHVHTQYLKNTFLRYYMFTYDTVIIIIISSLPKGRSLASKFSNSLGFQPSSSYPHMCHLMRISIPPSYLTDTHNTQPISPHFLFNILQLPRRIQHRPHIPRPYSYFVLFFHRSLSFSVSHGHGQYILVVR